MPESDPDPPVQLKRIAASKTYNVLADHLRRTILDGDKPEGARLPTERELVAQTGLSRGSVREARRMLEVEGLVRARPGRLGGNIVTRPGHDALAHFVGQFVRGRKLSLGTLQEARETIDPTLARFAAKRRAPKDVERLRCLNARMGEVVDDRTAFADANFAWHSAIGEASRNGLLAAFLYSMSKGVVEATVLEEYDTSDLRRHVLRAHERIIVAIEAGDPEAAYRRMDRHVRATSAMSWTKENRNLSLD
jgi:GntR family transcriptional repressor for pyruvate dehydrogenase complex